MSAPAPTLHAAIFDLDGTLLDSMGMWYDVDVEFLARRGIPMPGDYSAAIAPLGFPAAARYTKERFSLPESEEAIMAEWHGMALDAYTLHIGEKPFARAYLSLLREKNIPCAAATASHREYWEPALTRLGMLPFFSSVTEVREVSRGKGFPDIYLRAAEKLGVSPSVCAVYEDIPAGVTGAKAGGFYTVGVYDEHNRCAETLPALCDRYIRSFSELLEDDIFQW